ncbi:MAG: hypothetical protein ABIS42_05390 [Candidatus Limnocylindria bacterium]
MCERLLADSSGVVLGNASRVDPRGGVLEFDETQGGPYGSPGKAALERKTGSR